MRQCPRQQTGAFCKQRASLTCLPRAAVDRALAWMRDSERKAFAQTCRRCLTCAAVDRVPRVDAGY